MIVRKGDDFLASIFRDGFSRRRETLRNKWNKMSSINLVQKKEVAKLIKRHGRICEYFKHHMTLAPIKAVTRFLMLLPVSTKFSLEEKRVIKLGNVLKLIDASHYLKPFSLGNPLRKVKDFIGILLYFFPIKFNGNLIHRVGSDRYFWNKSREEFLRIFYSLIPSGCCSTNDAASKNSIELLLSFDVKQVYRTYLEMLVFTLCDSRRPVNKGTFPPTSWRNDDCINEGLEIVNQMGGFLLPVRKILICRNLAKYKRCFHKDDFSNTNISNKNRNYKLCNYKKCKHIICNYISQS